MVQLLIWAPVLLLPLANLIPAIVSGVNYDFSQSLVWVLGAVAEELFYRFFLLRKLLLERSELKPGWAVLLISLLFAGMHLFNLRSGMPVSLVLLQAFCAFCFSIWAGAVVWKTRSVMIPLLAHVLMNLTAFESSDLYISFAASLLTLVIGILLIKKPPACGEVFYMC